MLARLIGAAWLMVAPERTAPLTPDGSKLLRACSAAMRQADGAELSIEDSAQALWCIGYVGGFIDGLAVLGWRGGAVKVCLPPDGIELDQAIRIVVKYLRANPERLHESGRAALVVSIAQALACK